MNTQIVSEITARQIRKDIPAFSSGDTIRVYVRIIENKKERVQLYEGVVIQRRGHGVSETFTVRKISSGIGVERTFALNSPSIARIEVIKVGHVRRARIHYMRQLAGKAARIKETDNKPIEKK
jgi:large subunit ribosomal protein L19